MQQPRRPPLNKFRAHHKRLNLSTVQVIAAIAGSTLFHCLIAWTLAVFATANAASSKANHNGPTELPGISEVVDVYSGFGYTRLERRLQFEFGSYVPMADRIVRTQVEVGWPMRSMFWISRGPCGMDVDGFIGYDSRVCHGVIEKGMAISGGDLQKAIPLGVLWNGFLVDTAIMAGVICILHSGVKQMRRSARARAGRCTECGYPLSSNTRCTECGHE